jgi:hypothetical protein
MLSFAPIRYQSVLAEQGGPIARISVSTLPIFDRVTHQADAFLNPALSEGKPRYAFSGSADGTGSSGNPASAQHIAVSEALERWAYFATCNSGDARKYGFNCDSTSNGMAAFPGFRWQARRRARFEALERFALISWWDRRFPATVTRTSYPDVGLVHVHHNAGFGEVVILYHKAPTGFVAYGHGAGSTLASATSRAAVELIRCEQVIARHRARGALEQVTNHMELRCLHFASAAGHTEFLERAYARPDRPAPRWQTVFDGEIRGPWTRWTTVWRHCVEMPTYDYLNRKLNFFYW